MYKKSIALVQKIKEKATFKITEKKGLRNLMAKDAMVKAVFVYSDDAIDKITSRLKNEDTNVCIVVTKEKKFVGEISNEDLIKLFLHQVRYEPLTKLLNIGYKREFFYKTAKDLTNKHKSTVYLDTSFNEVIELVYLEGFQYIPVLDNNDCVVGVVTPSSILNLLEKY